jgi:hypothetical protein
MLDDAAEARMLDDAAEGLAGLGVAADDFRKTDHTGWRRRIAEEPRQAFFFFAFFDFALFGLGSGLPGFAAGGFETATGVSAAFFTARA